MDDGGENKGGEDRCVDDCCLDDGGVDDEYSAVMVGVQPEVGFMIPCGLTTAVVEVVAEEVLDDIEVVKPDISSSNNERRISPTKSSTTSAAAVLMLFTAGKAWGTMLSHGMRADDTILDEVLDEMLDEMLDEVLDEVLDEIADELRAVLLTRDLGALKLCCVFDAQDSS